MQIRYHDLGEGPLVILFHGFGGHPSNIMKVAKRLSKNHRVVVPFLSALYRSEIPLTFSQQVRIMRKFITHINPYREPFHLFGTSYGGALSVGVRREFSSLVLSHTLVNPMPFSPLGHIRNNVLKVMIFFSHFPFGLSLLFRSKFGGRTLRRLGKIFHMGISGKTRIQNFNRRKYQQIKKAVERFIWIGSNENWSDWRRELNDLVPTTLVVGSQDRVFEESDYRTYEPLFKNIDVIVVQYSGHLMVKWRPKKVVQIIEENMNRARSIDSTAKRNMKISLARSKMKVRATEKVG